MYHHLQLQAYTARTFMIKPGEAAVTLTLMQLRMCMSSMQLTYAKAQCVDSNIAFMTSRMSSLSLLVMTVGFA